MNIDKPEYVVNFHVSFYPRIHVRFVNKNNTPLITHFDVFDVNFHLPARCISFNPVQSWRSTQKRLEQMIRTPGLNEVVKEERVFITKETY